MTAVSEQKLIEYEREGTERVEEVCSAFLWSNFNGAFRLSIRRTSNYGRSWVLISTGIEGVDESEVLEGDDVGVLISTGAEGVDETDMLEVDDDRPGSTGVEGVDDSEMIDEDDVRAGSTGVSEEVLKADDVEIVELEIVGAVPNCKS